MLVKFRPGMGWKNRSDGEPGRLNRRETQPRVSFVPHYTRGFYVVADVKRGN